MRTCDCGCGRVIKVKDGEKNAKVYYMGCLERNMKHENLSDKCKRQTPIRYRWEMFKLSVTEFLARFKIYLDW